MGEPVRVIAPSQVGIHTCRNKYYRPFGGEESGKFLVIRGAGLIGDGASLRMAMVKGIGIASSLYARLRLGNTSALRGYVRA
eukprot:506704-Pyramimonas_sp.AAC.1